MKIGSPRWLRHLHVIDPTNPYCRRKGNPQVSALLGHLSWLLDRLGSALTAGCVTDSVRVGGWRCRLSLAFNQRQLSRWILDPNPSPRCLITDQRNTIAPTWLS